MVHNPKYDREYNKKHLFENENATNTKSFSKAIGTSFDTGLTGKFELSISEKDQLDIEKAKNICAMFSQG